MVFFLLLADPDPELVEVELLSGEGVASCGCSDRSCPVESADTVPTD